MDGGCGFEGWNEAGERVDDELVMVRMAGEYTSTVREGRGCATGLMVVGWC